MAKMLMKNGQFEGESWRLEGQKLVNGFYKVKELPLTKLLSLRKKQQLNDLFYVEFTFNNGIVFTASMNAELYEELQEVLKTCKKGRPLTELKTGGSITANVESAQQQAWRSGKIIAHRSEQNILQVLGWVIFVAIFAYGVRTSDLHRGETLAYQKACMESVNSLTGYDKTNMVGDAREIYYRNGTDDTFIFRCTEDKVQFYTEATDQWVNMIP